MPRRTWRTGANLRRRLYEILEHGTIGDRTVLLIPEQHEAAVRKQLKKLGYIPRKG